MRSVSALSLLQPAGDGGNNKDHVVVAGSSSSGSGSGGSGDGGSGGGRVYNARGRTPRLSFGCPYIDVLFDGGASAAVSSPSSPSSSSSVGCSRPGRGIHGGITEISGEAGCGKTQLCLQLALMCTQPVSRGGLNGSTAYICCGEGEFPLKRLVQLCQSPLFKSTSRVMSTETLNDFTRATSVNTRTEPLSPLKTDELLSRIHIEQCRHSEEALSTLMDTMPAICRDHNIRLLIIDRCVTHMGLPMKILSGGTV
jgi:hypothetical protein